MDPQPNNPLHGVKLVDILNYLEKELGWEKLADQVDIRCFKFDQSIKSSLVFLRKNQWARDQVESLYLKTLTKNSTRPKKEPKVQQVPNRTKYSSRN